jgi:hypothetical protein
MAFEVCFRVGCFTVFISDRRNMNLCHQKMNVRQNRSRSNVSSKRAVHFRTFNISIPFFCSSFLLLLGSSISTSSSQQLNRRTSVNRLTLRISSNLHNVPIQSLRLPIRVVVQCRANDGSTARIRSANRSLRKQI